MSGLLEWRMRHSAQSSMLDWVLRTGQGACGPPPPVAPLPPAATPRLRLRPHPTRFPSRALEGEGPVPGRWDARNAAVIIRGG
jgi:hypothetical protein